MEVDDGSGFLLYNWEKEVQFVPTVEISCEWATKKVHVLLVIRNMDDVARLKRRLSKYTPGIDHDGRPITMLSVSRLMDETSEATNGNALVIPAHCMTPWYGILGYKNHLLDITDELKWMPDAFETGLSADKGMIKQIANMDKVPLVSFSDAHSIHNVGREVTVFDCEFSWDAMVKAVRNNEIDTIEFPPPLGKYHITGHRKCDVKVYSCEDCWAEITCPSCGRKLTIGVDQRIQMLKDKDVIIDERYMIPLILLINNHLGIEQITRDTIELYKVILGKNKEINLLCDIPITELDIDTNIKLLIEGVRNRHIKIIPGYDGVYGIIVNTYKIMDDEIVLANKLKHEGKDYSSVWGRVIMMDNIMVKRDMVMMPDDEQVFGGRPIPAVCDGHD